MYSMVLVMALNTGVDVPDFGRRGCCGCYGRWSYAGCYGGWGYGGCSGGWGYGGWGYAGCYGGYGGWSYAGGYDGWGYGGVAMSYVSVQPMPSPATIVVTLPADARLKIDGNATRSTSGRRTFESPPLRPGKTFHYTLQVEHKGTKTSRTISVRAGEVTRVNLSPSDSTVAAR
jgi:uncharacterized protein (TIGR03000 family)